MRFIELRRFVIGLLLIALLCQSSGLGHSSPSEVTRSATEPALDAFATTTSARSDGADGDYFAAIDAARAQVLAQPDDALVPVQTFAAGLNDLKQALAQLTTSRSMAEGLVVLRSARQALDRIDQQIRQRFDAAARADDPWNQPALANYYHAQWAALNVSLDRVEQAAAAWQQAAHPQGEPQQALRQAVEQALQTVHARTPQEDRPATQQDGVLGTPPQEITPGLPTTASTISPAYVTQSSPPGPADLAATVDVQITPEIIALASSLGNSPPRIAAYVRDHVAFDPYYGSLKGSTATLWTRSANDYDSASLLLALLRASGTPSRYVTGIITLPVAAVQSWLGVTNADAAYNTLSGIPRDKIMSGGQLVAIRLIHTWVEAYVPYASTGSESAWLPIDPSYKLNRFRPLIAAPSPAFDRNAFFASVKTTLPQEIYGDQVRETLRTTRPGTTLSDLAYRGELVAEQLGGLPASLPYTVDGVLGEPSTAPESIRHKVILTVNDTASGVATTQLLTITLPLAQIANSRLTVSYINATNAMRPVIKVDGGGVATGGTTPLGNYNQISIGLIYPEYGQYSTTAYFRLVGGYHALALGVRQYGERLTSEHSRRLLDAVGVAGIPRGDQDATLGELLHLAGMRYLQRVHESVTALADMSHAHVIQNISNAMLSADGATLYLFDRPFAVNPRALTLDAKNLGFWLRSIDGNEARLNDVLRLYSMSSSALEHQLWEEIVNEESISTIKALQYASEQQIPTFIINQANRNQLVPQLTLPSYIVQSITSALDNGYTVTVHRDLITYNHWTGAGWIIEHPSGAFGYLINGQVLGGQTTDPNAKAAKPKGNQGKPPDPCGATTKPVTYSNGNMFHQFADIVIATRGPAFQVVRTYNSQSSANGAFGYGWTFTYAMRLVEDGASGNVTFTNDSGGEYLFTKNGTSYTPPARIFLTLTKISGGFTLRNPEGTAWSFNSAGQLTKITDRNGNAQTLTYAANRLSSVSDPLGRSLNFSYDGAGRITSIRDFSGRSWSYSYNSAGDLVSSTTPSDANTPAYTTTYEYYTLAPLQHNLKTITDPRGQKLSFTYYANDKAYQTIEPEGLVTTFHYLPLRNETQVVTSQGFVWIYRYDDNGFITRITPPDGNPILRTWDAAGNLVSYIDEQGYATTMTYDTRGNLLTLTDALGAKTSFTYDPSFSQLTSITNARGNKTTLTIDPANGNTLTNSDPLGKLTRYGYDGVGNLTALTDANNHTVNLNYNANNYISRVQDARGNAWALNRDALGRLLSSADALGNTTTYSYDALARITTATDAEGNRWSYSYDGNNNVTRQVDANGKATTYAYDGLNNLIAITDARGATTRFGYQNGGCSCGSSSSNLTSLTDTNGNTRRYEYDSRDRVISASDALGRTRYYSYDARGNLVRFEDENGNLTLQTFDKVGQLVRSQFADGSASNYSYDLVGNLLTAANVSTTLSYLYDARNQVTQVTDAVLGKTIRYSYDNRGNRATLTAPDGRVQRYSYDANDNPASLVDLNNVTTSFAFDAAERLTAIAPAAGQPGVRTTLAYDRASRLTKLTNASPAAATFTDSAYSYDKVGSLLASTTTGASAFAGLLGKASYSYDSIYRLTGVTLPNAAAQSYGYDNSGNRTQVTTSGTTSSSFYDESDRLTYGGATQYTYDVQGNLGSRTIGGQTTSYVWNKQNQLARIDYADGTHSSYSYDAFGRRSSKTLRNGTTVRYLYDGANILQEYDNAGKLVASYTHTLGVDHPISMTRGGRNSYYVYDRLGSVIGLTDGAGTVKASYVYDAWGNLTGGNAGGLENPYRYTGREYDSESGLYYYRARYYDPQAGRFISQDPTGIAGGINQYGYVAGNPVNAVDFSGLEGNVVSPNPGTGGDSGQYGGGGHQPQPQPQPQPPPPPEPEPTPAPFPWPSPPPVPINLPRWPPDQDGGNLEVLATVVIGGGIVVIGGLVLLPELTTAVIVTGVVGTVVLSNGTAEAATPNQSPAGNCPGGPSPDPPPPPGQGGGGSGVGGA